MKLIIPMAGMGKRMRPHSLTVPKPLIEIAGKSIVQRLAEEIVRVSGENIEEIGFIIGHFGEAVEKKLLHIAAQLGAQGKIYYQEEALGTAHAINCAAPSLDGKVIVAFADTLFKADFHLDTEKDGIIWVHKVEDPSAFGVVKKNADGIITDFVEKPKEFVSDEAIIGIYYFKDGQYLQRELQYLMDNNIEKGGEFQLTDTLENMKAKGVHFYSGAVREWLDCGNKNATVYTHQRVLFNDATPEWISSKAKISNSKIIEPCYIGDDVEISNSVIGPYVSIGKGSKIEDARIENSILQTHVAAKNCVLKDSMVGHFAHIETKPLDLSLSDYSTIY